MLNFAESVLECRGGSGWAGATGPHLHLCLDPGPHDVGLAGELATEVLIGLLFALLLQEGVVPLGHQLLHLGRAHGQGQSGGQPFAWRSLLGLPVGGWLGAAYLLPLGVDDLGGDGGVGVAARELDVVALGNPLGLLVNGQDGLPLPVSIRQR